MADGYILYDTAVSKETVTLSGPSRELSKIKSCTAEAAYEGQLTETVTLNTRLRFYTQGAVRWSLSIRHWTRTAWM